MSGPNYLEIDFTLHLPGFTLDARFQTPSRGVTALFGASGSGKTTLLRCIAGLEKTSNGFLNVNDEIWQNEKIHIPVHRRPIGFVFQDAALFSHLSVRKNLEYGYKRISPENRKIQPGQVIEWLGLSRLMDRRSPAGLSGGEKQRLAIGRALLTSPRLLLLDEPLSALDFAGKQEILPYLERLHRQLDIPVLYVSHALDEVTRLADNIVILEKGRVIASGAIHETLTRLDLAIARLDDAGALIEATVGAHDEPYHLTRLDFPGGTLWVGKVDQPIGSRVRARILARDVSVARVKPLASSISNIFTGIIVEIQNLGADKTNLRIRVGGDQRPGMLMARITRRSCDQLNLHTGLKIYAQVKSVALIT